MGWGGQISLRWREIAEPKLLKFPPERENERNPEKAPVSYRMKLIEIHLHTYETIVAAAAIAGAMQ